MGNTPDRNYNTAQIMINHTHDGVGSSFPYHKVTISLNTPLQNVTASSATTVTLVTWTVGTTTGTVQSVVADSLTTGAGYSLSVDAITTGVGIKVENVGEAMTSGRLIEGLVTASGSLAAMTGNVAKFASSLTSTDTSGTDTENYDTVLISRTDIMNGAGGTLDSDGAALKIETTATQTAGTLTQDVYGIEIAHNVYSTSDVAAIKITSDNGSSGTALGIDFSSFSVDEPVFKFITDATGSAKNPETDSQDDWVCVKNSAGTLLFIPAYAAA